MKNTLKISTFVFILTTIFFAISCNDDEQLQGNGDEDFAFELLTTDKDTLSSGEQATITAIAKGNELVYSWSATAGDILGAGSEVAYMATPCVAGNIEITCKVEAAYSKSESKKIKIYVE
ncbi:MAG: hypothetical protein K9G70_09245 [Prolixibacteraceae bacterium]|nr:hypothetical protein [Prolixibacteraceae bacterium]